MDMPDTLTDEEMNAYTSMPDTLTDEQMNSFAAPKKPKQPRQRGLFEKVYDASGSALQGATMGYGDEITAAIGSLFGMGYDDTLKTDRAAQKRYESENPLESAAFEIAGGLPTAFALPGGQAKTLGGMMKAGAAYGGLTGFGKGEGDFGNRLGSGAVGLATGAAVPVAIKGVTGTGKAIHQALRRSPVAQTVANEAGAILPQTVAPLTKAEATVFQRLRNVPTEQLNSMQDEMARALTEGTPLYLPEAGGEYGKKKLFDFASYIANREGGANFAERAIGERAKGAGSRIGGILDELSPQSDPRMGGFSLMDAVKGKVDELDEIRTKAADPYYKRAYAESPRIDPEDVTRFMRNNDITTGIVNKLRKYPKYANLPDNSRELMHRVKMELDDMLKDAALTKTDKADIESVKEPLLKLLDQVDIPDTAGRQAELKALYGYTPELSAADLAQTQAAAGPSAYGAGRATFAGKSAPIDEIMNGPLGGFLQHNYNPENVGTSVLGMSAPAVEIGIGQLGSADAMRAAARSGISKRIGNKGDTRNLAEALIGAENPRKMLSTLMGSDGAENILRRLEIEDRMAKGKNLYQRGSTTARNLLEEETFNKSGAVIDRLLKAISSPKGALFQTASDLKNLGLASGKEDLARALAGILFDTEQGAATLQKVIPYATRRNEIAGQYDNLAAALARGSRPLVNRGIPTPQGE